MADSPDDYVRPDVRSFLAYLNALPGPRIHEMQPEEARLTSRIGRELADVAVGDLAVIEDLSCPGPGGDIPLRLYDARPTRPPGPAVVFFHGGGWVLGDLDSHEPFCAEMARQLDMPVVSVAYRLAPENRWPAAPDDCEAAARWVASSPEALGRSVTGIVLVGDSAGGTLTIVTALALRDKPAAEPVLAQWPIYPAVDRANLYPSFERFGVGYLLSSESMLWFHEAYRADLDHWRGAPLKVDQAGMPPTLVLTASLDPLRDQGRAYAAATAKAGVPTIFREAVGNVHGLINLRKAVPSSEADIAGCFTALRTMIAESEADGLLARDGAAA